MKQASVSQLEAKREELTVAMQSTQAGCDFVDNLLNDGSDVDILGMEAQVDRITIVTIVTIFIEWWTWICRSSVLIISTVNVDRSVK